QLLPVPLNEVENRAFARMHLKQDFFGGLTSLMLHERFPQLLFILTNVWEDEDNGEAIAVMHRLLAVYAEMDGTRRNDDRLAKGRKAGTRNKKHVAVDVELPPEATGGRPTASAPDEKGLSVLDALADDLRTSQGISCGCRNPVWGLRVD